ncbi:MAG: NADH-quinone oxidoreductase subunit L [Weeksellaceae bacterium]
MEKYIWLIPLFPLLGFLINGLGRKHFSKGLVSIIGSGVVFISFLLSLMVFFNLPTGQGAEPFIYHAFDIFNLESIHIPFAFHIDALTTIFMLIITGVGFLIHVYAIGYMHDDEGFGKFFSYFNLFICSMLILVMGSNFLMMYIGWEGVGLCSYLLIGFWYKNKDFTSAARKAFIMNRIGDIGFLLAMFWIYKEFGTLEYREVFALLPVSAVSTATIVGITLLLFLAATGKSAQIPLFTWLPDAMAGPTPVSALIHAATMVTAGIFMLTRCHELFDMAPMTQGIVAWIGILTALLTATIAMRQDDVKKVLAYSTVSQLGLMFAAIGMGAYIAAVFHVLTHAFFKALLFMGSGSVIHAMNGEQDMKKMGGLKKRMPTTHITMLIACLAIAGIPPLSGFFSKDELLLNMFAGNKFVYTLGFVVSVLTAFYMFRWYFMIFHGKLRNEEIQPHESPKTMTVPMSILAVLSVIGGFIGIPALFAKDAHQLNNFMAGVVLPNEATHTVSHSMEILLMVMLLMCVLAAIALTYRMYNGKVDEKSKGLLKLFHDKWYVDEINDAVVVNPTIKLGNGLKKYVEKAGIHAGLTGVGSLSYFMSKHIKTIQSGNIAMYILLMVVGIVAGIGFFFFGIL